VSYGLVGRVLRGRWCLRTWIRYLKLCRRILDEYFKEYEIYLFGSVEEGYTMASDIDILIVQTSCLSRCLNVLRWQ